MRPDHISEIFLSNFRIHKNLKIEIANNCVLILGKNASGKTSILEAISLLKNGHGILGQENQEMISRNAEKSILLMKYYIDDIKIEIANNHRIYYLNEKKVKNNEIANMVKMLFFKPSLQYEFLSSQGSRNFFNHFVSEIFVNYHDNIIKYTKLMKERLKILINNEENSNISKWLDNIENELANLNFSIVSNRLEAFKMLNNNELSFYLQGDLEKESILNIEFIKEKLKNNRQLDKKTERTNFSCHRFNFNIALNEIKFQNLSNSQQKFSILSTLQIFADMIFKKTNKKPILLIDEISASFDNENTKKILENISKYFGQIFITSPNIDLAKIINAQIISTDFCKSL